MWPNTINKHFSLTFLLAVLIVITIWQVGCGRVVNPVSATTTTSTTSSSTTTNTIPDLFSVSFNPVGTVGLACGEYGALLRSTNEGETWVRFSQNESSLQEYVLNRVDFHRVYSYANTVETSSSLAGMNGVYLQANTNDASWETIGEWGNAVSAGPSAPTIYCMDNVAGTNKDMVVCSGGKIYLSAINQTNYSPITSETTADLKYFANGIGGTVVVVGSDGTILRSTNSAESFAVVTTEVYPDLEQVFYSGEFYALGANGTFLSSNNGASWSAVATTGIPDNVNLYSAGRIGSTLYLLGSGGNIFATSDLQDFTAINMHTDVDLLNAAVSASKIIIVGRDRVMLKGSLDGTTWQLSTDGGATWGASWEITLP